MAEINIVLSKTGGEKLLANQTIALHVYIMRYHAGVMISLPLIIEL